MTFVSNHFAECVSSVERIYTVEVVDFEGGSECVEVLARSASEAHEIAASSVGNADYTNILFFEAI